MYKVSYCVTDLDFVDYPVHANADEPLIILLKCMVLDMKISCIN